MDEPTPFGRHRPSRNRSQRGSIVRARPGGSYIAFRSGATNLPVYEVRRVSQGGRGRPWPSLDLPVYRAPGLRGEPVSTARRPPAVVPLPACGRLFAYAYLPPAGSPPPERRSLHGWAL